jgi:hypothetical protein
MRKLNEKEMMLFANKNGVKILAFDNFITSIDLSKPKYQHVFNLCLDSGLYKWNVATIEAILNGIDIMYMED